jgi:hypothetical protein
MCLDASTFFDKSWLASTTEEEQAQEPVNETGSFKYDFPDHIDFKLTAQARADLFVLTVETELYAVMYDKRKLIDQHALSQI